jgi:hypothetical protein
MGRGTFQARAATAALVLAAAGCGGSAAATPTPTPVVFGTSIPSPTGNPGGNPGGRQWTGTEHMVQVFKAPACSLTVNTTLYVVVSKGGQVSGTATGSWLYVTTSCKGNAPFTGQGTVPITGMLSSTHFQLTIPFGFSLTPLPVTVPLTSAKTAHADATENIGRGQRTYIIDLTCSHC